MTVPPLAAIISSYSLLAIPIVFLLQRPARMDLSFRLLFIYTLTAFIVDRIPELIDANSNAGRVLSFAFTIFEYILFTLLFYHFFQRAGYKRWVLVGSVIFVSTLIFELKKFGIVYYSRLNAGTAVLLIISYCLLLFHEWLMDDPMELIYKKAAFWITLGCLVYLSGNFFFFITVGKQWERNWGMHAVCGLVKNLFFVTAIVLQGFPATPSKKTA